MKKTFIVLIMVLLSAILIVSCDGNKNTPSKTISKEGDTIELGTKDGKAITWEALNVDTDGKKALLVSQDVLEERVFSNSSETADYKDSDIRQYLTTSTDNDGFIKTYDLSTDYMVAADLSDVNDGKEDYVFLLSEAEVTLYLGQQQDRVAKYNGSAANWWLRSHMEGSNEGTIVGDDGAYGHSPTKPYTRGLRPAFWYTWK